MAQNRKRIGYQSEEEVQSKTIAHFEKLGYLVVKILQSTKNGWPDLQCHKDGKTLFIECKANGETADPLQEYRHEQLRKKGFEVLVIDYICN